MTSGVPQPSTSNLTKLFELVKPISDYLYGYSLIATIVIVNALTLNLKLKPDEMTNSQLLIGPKGHGKTVLLHHILRRSNPDKFPSLPDKHFESEILKAPDEIFKNKIWIQDDLITTFRGTSSKQREQLMGFHCTFLTKGEYGRKERIVTGRIVCIYGMASEAVKKYAKQMFSATFNDRFMPIRYGFDEHLEREILKVKRKNRGKLPPTVKLPFSDGEADVDVPNVFEDAIDEMALELHRKEVMTASRAQTYIQSFLKSCAVLNGRSTVREDDLRLLRLVWPLHTHSVNLGSVDMQVRMLILEKSMEGLAVSGQEVKGELKNLGFSESAIQKVLSYLRLNNIVQFQQISLRRGYDYLYWI